MVCMGSANILKCFYFNAVNHVIYNNFILIYCKLFHSTPYIYICVKYKNKSSIYGIFSFLTYILIF